VPTAACHLRRATSSRRILRGTVRLELPPEQAFHLFTPASERLWAEGWDPVFPAGEHGDGGDVGTVFTTDAHGSTTIWVVVQRGDDSIRYARVTPGQLAGTVEVRLRPGEAEVTYDLTALNDHAQSELEHFAAGYEGFMAGWERAIADADAG
jgi:hypothetical protein